MREIDDETIKALLALDKKPIRQRISLVCDECNSRLDSGYCRNSDCSVDSQSSTVDCSVCGSCYNPDRCVASIECPRCNSAIGQLCIDDRGGLTGYHEERWLFVKREYGVYYR